MKLYSIKAYFKKDDTAPDKTFIIAAETPEEAEKILARTGHAAGYDKLELFGGHAETNVPGPQFVGWTGGTRLLKRG